MDVCFTARVSNKKWSIVTAGASQDAFTVISDQTQHWLLVPWKGILSVCTLVMMFAGERQTFSYTKSQPNKASDADFFLHNFKGN